LAHGGAAWAGAEAATLADANDQHRRADEVLCNDRIVPREIVGIHPYALKFPMMRSDEQLADLPTTSPATASANRLTSHPAD
jgi:hypothetical protein